MATLNNAINKSFFDRVLPVYGTPRVKLPTWDEGEKMFICDEYESENGHRYYKGIRFSNNIVIVEKVGLFHNWTYIDSIEIYAFNDKKLELVQKRDYQKSFRNEEFVRKETETMIGDYLRGVMKMQRCAIDENVVNEHVKVIVDGCYKSFLDSDFNLQLTKIIPQLEQK